MMTELEAYYNKFNEEKRLSSRHGTVEYTVSMAYILKYLEKMNDPKVLDIGAGTGRYSVALAEKGYDVTAVELVKYNLGILKKKNSTVKAYQGNALKLKRFQDNTFDLTLLFGPMYHLYTTEDKVKALTEANRVTKPGGVILVAYCMNDYAVIKHGIIENNIKQAVADGTLDQEFHCQTSKEDLYAYVRIDDIDQYNSLAKLERIQMIGVDGAANYIRRQINALDEESFELFIKYQFSICERADLMGANAHVVDILRAN